MMYHVYSTDDSDLTDLSLADKVDDALPNIQAWVPPTSLIKWSEMLQSLRFAAAQTGYARYSAWHDGFIRRQAEDKEKTSSVGSTKRPRVVR